MLVTKKSNLTGKEHTLDLPVTHRELTLHANGIPAQEIWPDLDKQNREFLISGITPDEWATLLN